MVVRAPTVECASSARAPIDVARSSRIHLRWRPTRCVRSACGNGRGAQRSRRAPLCSCLRGATYRPAEVRLPRNPCQPVHPSLGRTTGTGESTSIVPSALASTVTKP